MSLLKELGKAIGQAQKEFALGLEIGTKALIDVEQKHQDPPTSIKVEGLALLQKMEVGVAKGLRRINNSIEACADAKKQYKERQDVSRS
jgi:hypothetical protein